MRVITKGDKFTGISMDFDVEQSVFICDGRQHCSQMKSYEEAKFLLIIVQRLKWMETETGFFAKGNLSVN